MSREGQGSVRAGNARRVVGRTVGTQASQEVVLHLMGHAL